MRTNLMKRLGLAIAVAIMIGCGGGGGGGSTGGGGGGGGGTGSNNGVNLSQNSASLSFGQKLNLTATVPGQANQVVSWTVTPASGGTIAATGASSATYTAPGVAGSYTIAARADVNSALYGTCVVNVSAVGITLDPGSATIGVGKTMTFTANVTGSTNLGATFTAARGTIGVTGVGKALYTAPATTGTDTVTARAAADSTKIATATLIVTTVTTNATIIGHVRQDGTQIGIPNVIVAFYNGSGSEVNRATTQADGSFSLQVPTSARRFHVIASSISSSYYKAYTYSTLRYSALINTCTAPLPTLTAGQVLNLPSFIDLPSTGDPPPPPPNGCQ